MKPNNLFNILVNDHVNRDYFSDLGRFVNQGKYEDPAGREFCCGLTELNYKGASNIKFGNKGTLVIANGNTLPGLLKTKGIVIDDILSDPIDVESDEALAEFFVENRGMDGAFVYNSIDGKIIPVESLNNNNGGSINPRQYLPVDFSKLGADYIHKVGNRTQLAVKCPIWYKDIDVHSYLVKETAYSNLGTGTVAEFDQFGLYRSFHLEYRPDSKKDEFVDEAKGVVGVYRVYNRENGVSRENRKETIVGKNQLAVFDKI